MKRKILGGLLAGAAFVIGAAVAGPLYYGVLVGPNGSYLNVAPGTVGFPAVQSSVDSSTGIYWPAPGQMAFVAGGNTIATVSASGIVSSGGGNGLNILENGDYQVDAIHEGAAVVVPGGANLRAVDRWFLLYTASNSGAGPITVQRQTAGTCISNSSAVPYQLLLTMGSAGTSTPNDVLAELYQSIDAQALEVAQEGTSAATSISYSFPVCTSLTNTNISITFQNANNNRSFTQQCNIPTANTVQVCSGTFPGDTGGTWSKTQYNIGGTFIITLSAGSAFQGTLGQWNSGNLVSSATQTQMTNNGGATLIFGAMTLAVGGAPIVLTPDPVEIAQVKTQHWLRKTLPPGTVPAPAAGISGAICIYSSGGPLSEMYQLIPPMHAPPQVFTFNPLVANSNSWDDVTGVSTAASWPDPVGAKGHGSVQLASISNTVANHNYCIHAVFDTGK